MLREKVPREKVRKSLELGWVCGVSLSKAGIVSGSCLFFCLPGLFKFHFPPGHDDYSDDGNQSPDQLERLRQDREIDHGTHQYEEASGSLDDHGSGCFNVFQGRVLGKACQEWAHQRAYCHVECSPAGDYKAFLSEDHGSQSKDKEKHHPVHGEDPWMNIPDPAFSGDDTYG